MKIEKIDQQSTFQPFKIELTIESLREIEYLLSSANVTLAVVNDSRPKGHGRGIQYNIEEFTYSEGDNIRINLYNSIRDIYEELIE